MPNPPAKQPNDQMLLSGFDDESVPGTGLRKPNGEFQIRIG